MDDDEAWMLRPVHARMCTFDKIRDGTLDITDIAMMNDYLDIHQENEARYLASIRKKERRS